MRNFKVLYLLIAVVLVLSACGGGGSSDQPSAQEATTAPSSGQETGGQIAPATEQADVPTVASEEESLNLSNLTEGLAGLSSYKSRFTMTFSGTDDQGQPVNGTWSVEEDLIVEPRAQRTSMTSTGFSEGEVEQSGSFEVITVGDMSYMLSRDADGTESCISMSASEESSAEQGLFTPDMLGGINDAKYVGTETVNGVKTKHYTWQESSLPVFGFGSVKGDVWKAADGEYVVKYRAEATGKGTLLGSAETEGTVTFEYDLTEINGSFTIEVPASCETAATDIPMMADAQDKSTFGEMISYSSPSAMADVVAFYQAEMPNNGWQASGEPMVMEEFATLDFGKDGRTAQLMITYDSDSKTTSVIITTSKEE